MMATVIISAILSLALAIRALHSHGISFEAKAVMIVAWGLIIVGVAFAAQRMGLIPH